MKIFVSVLIFISFSLISIFAQVNEKLVKGDNYLNKFDLHNAATLYELAYKDDPKDYFVLLKISGIYNDLGEEYYEKRDDENSEKMIRKAIKYAEEFYNTYPDSAKVYSMLAWSYGNLALYEGGNEKVKLAKKIKENAEKSIAIDPNDYLPYVILGIYHRQIADLSWLERAFANTFYGKVPDGSFEDSEKRLKRALQLNPDITIAAFHLSLTYKAKEDKENEIKWLKKVISMKERNFRDKYAKRKSRERLKELLD